MKFAGQTTGFLENILTFFASGISPDPQQDPKHFNRKRKLFSRKRKLPFERLVVFILHIVSGDTKGIDIKSGLLFKTARHNGLWHNAQPATRSAVTKARKKLHWKVFESVFRSVVDLALRHWPTDAKYLWHGMSVFAIDGSKFTLPASAEIRAYFDPDSGLQNVGKGHYPQALVSTAFDVLRRIPVARTVMPSNTSERKEAVAMLASMPRTCHHGVVLFDRGYPSYELILYLKENYAGHFLFRCPASSTFPAVVRFWASGADDGIIEIAPSDTCRSKLSIAARRELSSLTVRVVRVILPNGEPAVYLTDLLDSATFSCEEIANLYRRRWEVETHYRDEKVHLDIETFHTRGVNGIHQELFAVAIMAVIARTLMALSMEIAFDRELESDMKMSTDMKPAAGEGDSVATVPASSTTSRGTRSEPQFKNAIMALGQDVAMLVADDPARALERFTELLEQIGKVKYYRPKNRRPSAPRVTKRNTNKWIKGRADRMNVA
ncbi:MAG: IS4 family transposase [Pirellulaceae bacterium]